MRRSLFILLALVVSCAALCSTAYRLVGHFSAQHLARTTDDLDWLRVEFRLGDAEMARIRQLHEGYLPTCRGYCDRIAGKQQELQAALDRATNITGAVEATLADIATLRAQCQAAMLRHFTEVSRVMPPEQGRRYLAEMRRLTLGLHEQVEDRMSGEALGAHGHR
jgi:hypothetical protein